jgi:glycosyltransferase involved in cell wall biosynthesis
MIEGQTGYMGNVGDVATMSEKALLILRDENRLQQFKDAAAKHAHKFDIKNIIPIYESLYNSVLIKDLV